MNKLAIVGFLAVFFAGPAVGRAQEFPAKPAKEHEWLKQLVGEWDVEAESIASEGQPAITAKGTDRTRMIGDLWVLTEANSKMMGMDITGIMTVGYDKTKKKFIGTWVDSMQNHLWRYEGFLDESGKVLTLEAEGPNFSKPGETSLYRDVIEIKSKDHKIMTSWMQGDDGEWTKFMTGHYRRKK